MSLGSKKGVALLAYLARWPGTDVPREILRGLLWPDSGEGQARASLRTALSTLRRALGDAENVVTGDMTSLTLDPSRAEIDTIRFDAAMAAPDDADAEVIAEMVRGEFLDGFGPVSPEFDRWAEAERATLRARFGALLLRLTDARFATGDMEGAIATAQRILALDPLQEHVHRRLMQAYHAQGRSDAALRQFDLLRGILDSELGVQPEPPTLELALEIRRARRKPATPAALPAGPASQPERRAPERPSIAVLRFRSLSPGPEGGLFGDGIAEDLIIELAREPGFLVVARQSAFRFSDTEHDPAEIGRILGVRFLVLGTIRLAGERVRVTAHLARCEDGQELWAERYDRNLSDIFEIQSEIARTVTGTVVGRIVALDSSAALQASAETLEGHALVMRGLRHMNTLTREDFEQAVDCFARAVEADPGNARALSLLALSRIYIRWYFDLDIDNSDCAPLAERAVAINPREARAHLALGIIALHARNFDRAAHHFQAGLVANPNDDLLMTEYGRFLMYDDRPEEGLLRIREAMRLNPFHPAWYWGMQGRCLHTLGRLAEARDAFLRVPDPPFYTHAYLAACHAALGDGQAAGHSREAFVAARPDLDLATFATMFPYRNPQTAAQFLETMQAAFPD